MSVVELLQRARQEGLRIATAESCTGGLLSAALTEVPGSSDVFERGFVTYSNRAKTDLLGVDAALIDAHGAVSAEVARAMVEGALTRSDAHLAVSITGVAGPGGTKAKPEGMVCFGIGAMRGNEAVINDRTRLFGAIGRTKVREASVKQAVDLLLRCLN
ncbi:MAG: CinA family protein [Pseudomonadota bacterium]